MRGSNFNGAALDGPDFVRFDNIGPNTGEIRLASFNLLSRHLPNTVLASDGVRVRDLQTLDLGYFLESSFGAVPFEIVVVVREGQLGVPDRSAFDIARLRMPLQPALVHDVPGTPARRNVQYDIRVYEDEALNTGRWTTLDKNPSNPLGQFADYREAVVGELILLSGVFNDPFVIYLYDHTVTLDQGARSVAHGDRSLPIYPLRSDLGQTVLQRANQEAQAGFFFVNNGISFAESGAGAKTMWVTVMDN